MKKLNFMTKTIALLMAMGFMVHFSYAQNLITGTPHPMAPTFTGTYNALYGDSAGNNMTTASYNTYLGESCGPKTTSATGGVYIGYQAGHQVTGIPDNTYVGYQAGYYGNMTSNTCIGFQAGLGAGAGGLGAENTIIGSDAGQNSAGADNVFIGIRSGAGTTNSHNVFVGSHAAENSTNAMQDVFIGDESGHSNTTGSSNVFIGNSVANNANSGNNNVDIGAQADNDDGSNMTIIGYNASVSATGLSNSTALGNGASVGASNSIVIGNSSVTSIGGYAAWTNLSDGRMKRNISENVPGMEFISQLRPVTYTLDIQGINKFYGLKEDPALTTVIEKKEKIVYTGFIAQEVEKAANSIGYNFSGVDKPENDQKTLYGLRYSDFVVPIVKGMQEQQQTIKTLQNQNSQLQQEIANQNSRLATLEEKLGELTLNNTSSPAQNNTNAILQDNTTATARLDQNIPNPFDGSTIIGYFIPANAQSAIITVSTQTGQAIKTFVITGRGNGQVEFDSQTLFTGMYLYNLVVDGVQIDSKKMSIVKN